MSDLLIDLVRRYSPSEQEAPAVETLVAWMRDHGFDQAWIDAAGNACGSRGSDDAAHTLILLGHIDTVPGDIAVRVEDGILYGRGSVDAKGPLCAFAEATAQAAIPDGWRVIVVGAVEEEAPSSKGAHHVRDLYTPDLCVIGEPSGADRIALGYKGHVMIDYALARPVAHTSRPEPSVGALGAAFWQRIVNWCAARNNGTGRDFDQVFSQLRAINTASDGFMDSVRLTIGFRLPPGLTPEGVLAAASELAEPDADLRAYSTAQAYLGDKNTPLARGMLAAIRAQGARPATVLKGGTSDMNVVGAAWTCPIIAYGPGDSHLDHTPDEHLSLAEYAQAVATLRHLIEHLD
jgi:LysW-gamma-L-lysine carboxypeptidase